MPITPPIFINVRDRVRDLRKLVTWLEGLGQERIILLDNASTYEPLIDYLEDSPHEVVWFGTNRGSRSIWNAEMVPDEPFIFTDPDLTPLEECPDDAIDRLAEQLDRFPKYPKVAMGLHLDDLPDEHPLLPWERSLIEPRREIANGVFDSLVDTTFALYRPKAPFGLLGIRLGYPYQMRHSSWYVTEPDEEDSYYLSNAVVGELGSSWAQNYRET